MGTRDTLVEDLIEKPKSDTRDDLIKNAQAGMYDDWASEYACPKKVLVDHLTEAGPGYENLITNTKSGKYDEGITEDTRDEYSDNMLAAMSEIQDVLNNRHLAGFVSLHNGKFGDISTSFPEWSQAQIKTRKDESPIVHFKLDVNNKSTLMMTLTALMDMHNSAISSAKALAKVLNRIKEHLPKDLYKDSGI